MLLAVFSFIVGARQWRDRHSVFIHPLTRSPLHTRSHLSLFRSDHSFLFILVRLSFPPWFTSVCFSLWFLFVSHWLPACSPPPRSPRLVCLNPLLLPLSAGLINISLVLWFLLFLFITAPDNDIICPGFCSCQPAFRSVELCILMWFVCLSPYAWCIFMSWPCPLFYMELVLLVCFFYPLSLDFTRSPFFLSVTMLSFIQAAATVSAVKCSCT